MRFVSLYNSKRKGKKYVITFENPTVVIHFGAKGSSTYLDHRDEVKRENYLRRHAVNENWDEVNAGSLSAYLLWGPSTDLETNLELFLKRFDII